MMDAELQDRSYLVTGASGGIGRATALALADEGARVTLHFHRGEERARLIEREIRDGGGETHLATADLRRESEVQDLFVNATGRWGRLDGLVVNAGIWPEQAIPIADLGLDQWQETLSVNLTGAFLCCRAFLQQLRESGGEHGAIVLVGSTAGLYGEEGHGDYAASKAALGGLALTLKNEIVRIAARGRVNVVHPGWVATPMAEEALRDLSLVGRVTATMALRKVAQPEDVARAIVFLLSDRLAGHLSGAQLPIAGGMEGRLLHDPENRREGEVRG